MAEPRPPDAAIADRSWRGRPAEAANPARLTISVLILLATFNGAQFLQAQLDSYLGQTLPDWQLRVSDDGSTDGTGAMLERFRDGHPGRVTLLRGPGQGAAENFMSLIRGAPAADHVAFSDQDDVWLPEKIARAVDVLKGHPADRPAVYASRVRVCDRQLHPLRISKAPDRPPGFRNALVQNVLHGHSVVLNRAAQALLRRAADLGPQVVMHDWWIYQTVSGAGGRILFDEACHVLYRQHDRNAVGAGRSLLGRAGQVQHRVHAAWMTTNLQNLSRAGALLTPEYGASVQRLLAARASGRLAFAQACLREGLYRQGPGGQLLPAALALLGRL